MVGRLAGVVIGLGLTWLINRRWPTPLVCKPVPKRVRETTSMPEFVADAVRDSADTPR